MDVRFLFILAFLFLTGDIEKDEGLLFFETNQVRTSSSSATNFRSQYTAMKETVKQIIVELVEVVVFVVVSL